MRLQGLIDFLIDPADVDVQTLDAYLEQTGIDAEHYREECAAMIHKKKIALLMERGKNLQQRFVTLSSETTDQNAVSEPAAEYRIACRNIEDLSESDKKLMQRNIDILRKMGNKE